LTSSVFLVWALSQRKRCFLYLVPSLIVILYIGKCLHDSWTKHSECGMRYLTKWKFLEDIVAEFRRKGVAVPVDVINNLKSAKTMIMILQADTRSEELTRKIERHLEKVEVCLVSKAQQEFGVEFVDEWLKKLEKEPQREDMEAVEGARFVPSLPRGQKWVRVKSSAEMSIKELRKLAEESGLSCTEQSDGYLLVCGEEQLIEGFVKKMAIKYGLKDRK